MARIPESLQPPARSGVSSNSRPQTLGEMREARGQPSARTIAAEKARQAEIARIKAENEKKFLDPLKSKYEQLEIQKANLRAQYKRARGYPEERRDLNADISGVVQEMNILRRYINKGTSKGEFYEPDQILYYARLSGSASRKKRQQILAPKPIEGGKTYEVVQIDPLTGKPKLGSEAVLFSTKDGQGRKLRSRKLTRPGTTLYEQRMPTVEVEKIEATTYGPEDIAARRREADKETAARMLGGKTGSVTDELQDSIRTKYKFEKPPKLKKGEKVDLDSGTVVIIPEQGTTETVRVLTPQELAYYAEEEISKPVKFVRDVYREEIAPRNRWWGSQISKRSPEIGFKYLGGYIPVPVTKDADITTKDIKQEAIQLFTTQKAKVEEKKGKLFDKQDITDNFNFKNQQGFEKRYKQLIQSGSITYEEALRQWEISSEYNKLIRQYERELQAAESASLTRGQKLLYGWQETSLDVATLGSKYLIPETYLGAVGTAATIYGGYKAIGFLGRALPPQAQQALLGAEFAYGGAKLVSPQSTASEAFQGALIAGIAGSTLAAQGIDLARKPFLLERQKVAAKSVLQKQLKYNKLISGRRPTVGKQKYEVLITGTGEKIYVSPVTSRYQETLIAGSKRPVTTYGQKLKSELFGWTGAKPKLLYTGNPFADPTGYSKAYTRLIQYGYTPSQARRALRFVQPRTLISQFTGTQFISPGEKGTVEFFVKGSTTIKQPSVSYGNWRTRAFKDVKTPTQVVSKGYGKSFGKGRAAFKTTPEYTIAGPRGGRQTFVTPEKETTLAYRVSKTKGVDTFKTITVTEPKKIGSTGGYTLAKQRLKMDIVKVLKPTGKEFRVVYNVADPTFKKAIFGRSPFVEARMNQPGFGKITVTSTKKTPFMKTFGKQAGPTRADYENFLFKTGRTPKPKPSSGSLNSQILTNKQDVVLTTAQKAIPVTAQPVLISKPSLGVIGLQATSLKALSLSATTGRIGLDLIPDEKAELKARNIQNPEIGIIERVAQQEKQAQASAQVQIQVLRQADPPTTQPPTGPPTTPRRRFRDSPEPEVPPLEPFKFEFPSLGRRASKAKTTTAYNVEVKSRGKWKKINKKPHTFRSARSYGAEVVDKTTSRQFRVKPIMATRKAIGKKKKMKTQKLFKQNEVKDNPGYWGFNRYKFRDFKQTKGKRTKLDKAYIERSAHAIDSRGEKRGLSVARFLKSRTTRSKKRNIFGF